MLLHEHTVPGLGDAGAHCGLICDGSFPTYLLSHWGRSRTRGERIPIETLVKGQTADTAALVGLHDRGRLAPGRKADVNLIDLARLGMRPPEIVHDLPAGGKRLVQRATGYVATVCSGVVTFENGESTRRAAGQARARPADGLTVTLLFRAALALERARVRADERADLVGHAEDALPLLLVEGDGEAAEPIERHAALLAHREACAAPLLRLERLVLGAEPFDFTLQVVVG